MASTGTAPINSPVILVVSHDEDFANPLAQQVLNELALPCAVVPDYEAAKPLPPSVTLVVTNEAVGDDCPCPVLRVSQPPFKMQVILKDIMAARQKQLSDDTVLCQGYRLQPRQKELLHQASGKSVSLTDKEVRILQTMADISGAVVSKEQLLKQVWGMGAVLETHTLETHIYRLRGKFRELGGDENIIIAADGGYKLMEA
jgi:DNA-binding winged helix-turn-helix (wHTH) protein